jgi:hypothetical protein
LPEWHFKALDTWVNVRDAVLRGISATGFSGPLLTIENTTGSSLEGAVAKSK